jgi:hypothetical protein
LRAVEILCVVVVRVRLSLVRDRTWVPWSPDWQARLCGPDGPISMFVL